MSAYRLARWLSVFVSTVLALTLDAQSSTFVWPDGNKAAVSLTFDDARLSHPLIGKDLFDELDVKATFYVLPDAVEERLEDWKDIVADGHEIGNHTIHHPCTGNFLWSRDKALENYTMNTMREELSTANRRIKNLLGIDPVSFAYTCGNTFVGRGQNHLSYVPLVAELFESGRGWLNEAHNDPLFADLALIQGIEMDGKDFEKEIKPLVDAAVQQGSWLVLAGHEIGDGGFQTTRVAMLRQLVEYINRPGSGIWIAPVGDVTKYINGERSKSTKSLQKDLTFYTSFDQGTVADYAAGDSKMYWSPAYKHTDEGPVHSLPEEIMVADGTGRFGSALEFKRKGSPVVFYQSENNMPYKQSNWSGTVSFWLSLDPNLDLAPGYTDPVQITDSGYDDAALWVDFTDKNPRSFRMGVFGDVEIWNPDKIGPDENKMFTDRLLEADGTPFGRGKWTHIAMVFSQLNSENGKAILYVNAKTQGSRAVPENFTWDISRSKIYLGLNYIGLIDDVAIFDRALDPADVESIFNLPNGIRSLLH